MKKLLFKISILLFAVIAINNIVFCFIKLPFSWGYYYDKEKCLETNIGRYNTIFIGSSRVGRQIDPVLFDSINNASQQNTSSINMGMDAMTIAEAYYQFNHIISQKNLKAKYILIELCDVDTFAYINLHTIRKKYYFSTSSYYNSITSLLESQYPTLRKVIGAVWQSFNFLEHLIKFNELGSVVKFKKVEQNASCSSGTLYDPLTINEKDTSKIIFNQAVKLNAHAIFMRHSSDLIGNREKISSILDENHAIAKVDKAYLRMANDMIDRGKSDSVKVIFILSPKLDEAHYRTVLAVYNSLKPENRIDLSDPAKYPEFYYLKYTYDMGHLDKEGSTLYTSSLSEQFLKIAGGQ